MKLARPDVFHPRIVLAGCPRLVSGDGDDAGLVTALRGRGLHAKWLSWDDPDTVRADVVILRATWDYAERLEEFAMRRVSGEPLSKIVGRREFWGLALSISPDVLDPRPETETIVEAAIALFAERRQDRLRVLDLGVGSGALLCALLHEFVNARGLGVDISAAAAEVARRNAAACGLAGRADIHVGTWADGVVGPFDLIVSNPPYVRTSEIESLSPEIRNFDPRLALDGGIDGLDAYRVILPAGARLVAPDGWLIIEAGAGQAGDVLAIAAKAGFLERSTRRDLAGVERVVVAGTPRSAPGRRNLEGDNRHERVIASE